MRPAQQPHWRSGVAAWWRNLRGRRVHPALTTLSRYVDDDLPLPERVVVDEHVRECGPCRRMLESLAQTIGGLRSLRTREPSERAGRIIVALTRATPGSGARQDALPIPGGARAAVRYCLRRAQLRFTVPAALVVGTVLTVVNMGGMLFSGQLDLTTYAACAADYFLPFLAMNAVLIAAIPLARRE